MAGNSAQHSALRCHAGNLYNHDAGSRARPGLGSPASHGALTPPGGEAFARELMRPGARVWIRDICDPEAPKSAHADTVIVVVGEPRSIPFEEAKGDRANSYFLSYEESRTQLRRLAPLAAELAESRSVLSVLQGRQRR